MAILQIESGEIFISSIEINKIIAPHKIGEFTLEPALKNLLAFPIKATITQQLRAPKTLDQEWTKKGLIKTGGGCLWQGADERLKNRINTSMLPHLDYGDEAHVCFAGGLIIYFLIANTQMALIMQPQNWIFIKQGLPVWAKPTNDYFLTFISYHGDMRDQIEKKYVNIIDRHVL